MVGYITVEPLMVPRRKIIYANYHHATITKAFPIAAEVYALLVFQPLQRLAYSQQHPIVFCFFGDVPAIIQDVFTGLNPNMFFKDQFHTYIMIHMYRKNKYF